MRIIPAALALALALVVGVSACGGGGGGDLTGAVDIPDGYAQYRGAGVSFVYPAAWKVEETKDAQGVPGVSITTAEDRPSPTPLIQLTIVAKAEARFDSFVDQSRVITEEGNDGELGSEDEVELPGAKRTRRTTHTYPPRRGTDPVEVRSAALQLVRGDGDIVVLTAATPQREPAQLDEEAVIDSFRLLESS